MNFLNTFASPHPFVSTLIGTPTTWQPQQPQEQRARPVADKPLLTERTQKISFAMSESEDNVDNKPEKKKKTRRAKKKKASQKKREQAAAAALLEEEENPRERKHDEEPQEQPREREAPEEEERPAVRVPRPPRDPEPRPRATAAPVSGVCRLLVNPFFLFFFVLFLSHDLQNQKHCLFICVFFCFFQQFPNRSHYLERSAITRQW